MDYWNSLIRVQNNIAKRCNSKRMTEAKRAEYEQISRLANCHLNALSTAGGKHIIKRELETFFAQYGHLAVK